MATIDWTGENPGLLLREGDDGPATTLASLFRVIRSPHGYGHATFLLRNPQTPGTGNACYTDNPELAAWLQEYFLQHFEPYRGLPALESLAMIPAEFAFAAESRDPWIETVRAGDDTLEFRWSDLGEPYLVDNQPDATPTGKHHLVSVFLDAGNAQILVNGEKLPGEPMPRNVGGRDITSAFLAFSETWIRD
jgi:hypothetical protein